MSTSPSLLADPPFSLTVSVRSYDCLSSKSKFPVISALSLPLAAATETSPAPAPVNTYSRSPQCSADTPTVPTSVSSSLKLKLPSSTLMAHFGAGSTVTVTASVSFRPPPSVAFSSNTRSVVSETAGAVKVAVLLFASFSPPFGVGPLVCTQAKPCDGVPKVASSPSRSVLVPLSVTGSFDSTV